MAGWSSKKLYDRQQKERKTGGFGGGGCIYDRLERPENLPELERIGGKGGSVQADQLNEGYSGHYKKTANSEEIFVRNSFVRKLSRKNFLATTFSENPHKFSRYIGGLISPQNCEEFCEELVRQC
ncbi:hypothetical protein CASFOL_000308 [Castilleja foliolosa]|uniref:Uncharacterized protein n=1 Tax=Castilleja foliolosa TaxID=1961234 RepID=A0ABD3EQG6_9LAMI